MLKIDTESDDYRFFKTLNEDVKLKPDEYNRWDILFENKDYKNVTGNESLINAICIAIMTRYQELTNTLYSNFGCRAHELIKDNQSEMVRYKIELFIENVLEQMRRIKEINWINVTEYESGKYKVIFKVKSISDSFVEGSVTL